MKTSYAIDNSAILYLAQMGPDHANVYRFTVTLREEVDPECLQQAAQRVYVRFPTIFAGFRSGVFHCRQVAADAAPVVQEDPGLLHTMGPEEMSRCAYRIYYAGNQLIMEAFHALTDGYGAIASLRALVGEYLYQRHGISTPDREAYLVDTPDWEEELRDSYLDYCEAKASSAVRCPSYQLPREDMTTRTSVGLLQVSTGKLLAAAKAHGVSMTSLLSGLMAEAIMELQEKNKRKPVRIMVPIDLRRQFPSRTFRNFILYALPALLPEEADLPRKQRLQRFQEQLRSQSRKELLAAQIVRNVQAQRNVLFRCLPWRWKCALMRLSYHFFGEINSSITLTNLGPVPMSEEMLRFVESVVVYLTPRRKSPYNCGLLSCGDTTSITLSRFGSQRELEDRFFSKLKAILAEV